MYGVIMNFIQAYKYRGGWRGLLEHMYTVRIVFEGSRIHVSSSCLSRIWIPQNNIE
jgi:hypothetical protein